MNIDPLKEFLFPIVSLIFSTFAFIFTLKNEFQKKFNLSLMMLDESESEWVVDRMSNEEPDVYHQDKFRFLPTVVITNKSSVPLTITRFSLNTNYRFGPFSKMGNNYKVTYQASKKKIPNGGFAYGGTEKALVSHPGDFKSIQPAFTLKPYESVVGVLFFHYNESLIGTNTLTIETSRGSKEFQIQISKQVVSKLITDYVPPQLD